MASLRRVYEEQTEKAKNEFMYLHSAKVILYFSTLDLPESSYSNKPHILARIKSLVIATKPVTYI